MANYTAQLNQWVPVSTNTEDNNITAPASPSEGHWFGVKFINVTGGPATGRFVTNVLANAAQTIEDIDGKGQVASTEVGFNYEGAVWHWVNGAWWRMHDRPTPIPEMFDKDAGSLPIDVNTPIPLVLDPTLVAVPTYFQVDGGNLRCIRPFAGSMVVRVYFEFVIANNQDASGLVELTTIAGTPQYRQGKGVAMSWGHSRAGTYYMTGVNQLILIAAVDDIIGLIGSDDPTQSGTTYVLEDSGIMVWPV